jgi:hypothetical protein
MYLNKTQAETVFYLIANEDEKLSLGKYRLNFIANRQELVELLEKIAPTLTDKGWGDSPEWIATSHRKALDNDIAERLAVKCSRCECPLLPQFKSPHRKLCIDCYNKAE